VSVLSTSVRVGERNEAGTFEDTHVGEKIATVTRTNTVAGRRVMPAASFVGAVLKKARLASGRAACGTLTGTRVTS
jgi:hypothetical protein